MVHVIVHWDLSDVEFGVVVHCLEVRSWDWCVV